MGGIEHAGIDELGPVDYLVVEFAPGAQYIHRGMAALFLADIGVTTDRGVATAWASSGSVVSWSSRRAAASCMSVAIRLVSTVRDTAD